MSLSVSVIVLSYNNEKFLKESIDSVLNQTRKADEIIVCDDASTDRSIDILNNYSKDIKSIVQRYNQGPLLNCLTGIELASSDILFFLDSDDIWELNKLEKIACLFEEDESIAICSHRHVHINEKGEVLAIYDETHRNMDRIMKKHNSLEALSNEYKKSILFTKGGFWLGSAYSFRRKRFDYEFFKRTILEFNARKEAYADLTIAPFLIATNKECLVRYKDEVLFKYRRHLNGATPSIKDPKLKISSIKRISKTSSLTKDILESITLPDELSKDISKRYCLIMQEYDYLLNIYMRNILKSIMNFGLLVPHFIEERKLIKETIRLMSTVFIGSKGLLKISDIYYKYCTKK